MEHLDDDLNTLDELEEDAIEVKPELQRTENLANRSLRNSTVVDDDPDGKKQFRCMYLEVFLVNFWPFKNMKNANFVYKWSLENKYRISLNNILP